MQLRTSPDHSLDITLENITGADARAYLELNSQNRKPRKSQLALLKRDLMSGNWRLTHQGIAFGTSGRLLDGQHRLLAIAETNITAPILVFRNIPETTQEVCDTVAGRTVAENLTLLDGLKDATKLAAYVNVIAQVWGGSNTKVSLAQAREILRLFPKLKTMAEADSPKIQPIFRRAHFTASIGLALHIEPSTAAAFFDAFTLGRNLTEGHPALILREFAMRTHSCTGYARDSAFRRSMDCCAAFLRGESLRSLKEAPDGAKYFRDKLAKKYTHLRSLLALD